MRKSVLGGESSFFYLWIQIKINSGYLATHAYHEEQLPVGRWVEMPPVSPQCKYPGHPVWLSPSGVVTHSHQSGEEGYQYLAGIEDISSGPPHIPPLPRFSEPEIETEGSGVASAACFAIHSLSTPSLLASHWGSNSTVPLIPWVALILREQHNYMACCCTYHSTPPLAPLLFWPNGGVWSSKRCLEKEGKED